MILRSIKYGLDNLLSWAKVIWNDRQWDYTYLFIILTHKLERMEKFYRTGNVHLENSLETAEQIHICVHLLDRLLSDVHNTEAMKDFYQKYPDFNTRMEQMFLGDKEYVDNKEETEDFLLAVELEEYLIDEDLQTLFGMMAKNVRTWWD